MYLHMWNASFTSRRLSMEQYARKLSQNPESWANVQRTNTQELTAFYYKPRYKLNVLIGRSEIHVIPCLNMQIRRTFFCNSFVN